MGSRLGSAAGSMQWISQSFSLGPAWSACTALQPLAVEGHYDLARPHLCGS